MCSCHLPVTVIVTRCNWYYSCKNSILSKVNIISPKNLIAVKFILSPWKISLLPRIDIAFLKSFNVVRSWYCLSEKKKLNCCYISYCLSEELYYCVELISTLWKASLLYRIYSASLRSRFHGYLCCPCETMYCFIYTRHFSSKNFILWRIAFVIAKKITKIWFTFVKLNMYSYIYTLIDRLLCGVNIFPRKLHLRNVTIPQTQWKALFQIKNNLSSWKCIFRVCGDPVESCIFGIIDTGCTLFLEYVLVLILQKKNLVFEDFWKLYSI